MAADGQITMQSSSYPHELWLEIWHTCVTVHSANKITITYIRMHLKHYFAVYKQATGTISYPIKVNYMIDSYIQS